MPNQGSIKKGQFDQPSVCLQAAELKGSVKVPSSKSIGHRAIICASLCEHASLVKQVSLSEDIEATLHAMQQFGARVDREMQADGSVNLTIKNPQMTQYFDKGMLPMDQLLTIECHESGSTARFLIPLFFLNRQHTIYVGTKRLSERPYDPYYALFDKQSIFYETTGLSRGLPLKLKGHWESGIFMLRGDISSQFISGLMFALPLISGESRIQLSTQLESRQYVELTSQCLSAFGIQLEIRENDRMEIVIKGKQRYQSCEYTVEGDYSQAAFWLVANYLGGKIELNGLNIKSLQGDRVIVDIIEKLTEVRDQIGNNRETTTHETTTYDQVDMAVDVSQSPDLVPILAVMFALTPGNWEITGAARLRIKESDRLKAITTELCKLGATIEEKPEGLVIRGKKHLHGGEVESWNDHRIAMALAIAATKIEEPVILYGSSCVNKSYPEFWDHYQQLGGQCHGK